MCSAKSHVRFSPESGHAVMFVHRFGLIVAAKDCAMILPFRTTNVSVANWYELSAVSAVQRM
jgi:hypothetical protein